MCGRLDGTGAPDPLQESTDDFLRVFDLPLNDLPEVKTRAPPHEGDVFPIENLETTVPTDKSSGRVSAENTEASDTGNRLDEGSSENSED